MDELALMREIPFELGVEDALTTGFRKELGADADQAPGGNDELQAHAAFMLHLVLDELALAGLEHLGDATSVLVGDIEDSALVGLEPLAVGAGLIDHLRAAHHDLEAFAADLLDENCELQLATAQHLEVVRAGTFVQAQSHVVAHFPHQALFQLAGLDGLTLLASQWARVDGENHAHGGGIHRDAGKGLGATGLANGVADGGLLETCNNANISGQKHRGF